MRSALHNGLDIKLPETPRLMPQALSFPFFQPSNDPFGLAGPVNLIFTIAACFCTLIVVPTIWYLASK